MPGAVDAIISFLEERFSAFPQISSLIQSGHTPEDILRKLFDKEQLEIHEKVPVYFECTCSKDRMLQAIKGLGKEEITAMIKEDHGAEATCHFCNEVYQVTETELENL